MLSERLRRQRQCGLACGTEHISSYCGSRHHRINSSKSVSRCGSIVIFVLIPASRRVKATFVAFARDSTAEPF